MVSVVIPTWDSEKTIAQSLQSVLFQTERRLQVIVVDDGSTDNTVKIVQSLAEKDERISLIINNSNEGVSAARNKGCKASRGEYIAFLDSDDIWEPDKLEVQLDCLQSSHADLCYTSYSYINANGARSKGNYRVPPSVTYSKLLLENYIGCSTVLLRAQILKKHSFSTNVFHEDYALWLKLLRGGIRAVGVAEPLVYYRTGGRSSDKVQSARYRWKIYRDEERLPFLKSLFYFSFYCLNGIRKQFKKNTNKT